MKIFRRFSPFAFLLMLLPIVARSQTTSLMNDPVFRAARKAQQEGRIADAEKILNDRIHSIEQTQPDSTELVPYLNLLASMYFMEQKRPDTLALYERVLKIDRSAYGPDDYRSVRDLINVASFLGPEKKDQQEQLFKQALDLALQNPKSPPVTLAETYSHLAGFYVGEKRLYDAEALAEQGVKICASVSLPPGSGPCDFPQRTLSEVYRNEGRSVESQYVAPNPRGVNIPPELAALDKSANQSEKDGLYVQAEFTSRQAVAWIEAHPTWTDGKMTMDLTGLLVMEYARIGDSLVKQGRDELAEEAYKNAIASEERKSADNQITRQSFSFFGLRDLYRKEKRLDELDPIIERGLELQEKTVGDSSTKVAQTLVLFGNLYKDEGKYSQAEPLYERAMKIYETNLGPDDRQEVFALSSYADLLRKMHDDAKAAEIQERIKKIATQ